MVLNSSHVATYHARPTPSARSPKPCRNVLDGHYRQQHPLSPFEVMVALGYCRLKRRERYYFAKILFGYLFS
jgi:hypothetical protein